MHVPVMIAMLQLSGSGLASCEGFAGRYREVGVVEQASGALPAGADVSLSLAVFRQAMPGRAQPEAVTLAVSPHGSVLRVALEGEGRLEKEWPVTCANGEYRIERRLGDSPAGEGVDRVRGAETIVLRPDATGLSVSVVSEARYRVWPFFRRAERLDDRYRFLHKTP
jgi:hypothetical protein